MSLKVPVLVCFCQTDTSRIKVLRSIKPDEDWEELRVQAHKDGMYARILISDEEIGEYEYKLAQTTLNYRNYLEKLNDSH